MDNNVVHDPPPPHSKEIEEALLGALLISSVDPRVLDLVRCVLRPDDFYFEHNKWIYETILVVGCDYRVVAQDLSQKGRTSPDPYVHLASLMSSGGESPNAYNAEQYAKTIRRLALARRVLGLSGRLAATAYQAPEEMELMVEVERVASEVRGEVQSSADLHLFGTDGVRRLMEHLDSIERMVAEGRRLLNTPWRDLNAMLSPLLPGQLIVVAAATGHGKTIFLECQAEYGAMNGHNVLFYHLELSDLEMMRRATMRLSDTPLERSGLDSGTVDRSLVAMVGEQMQGWPGKITYVHCPGWTATQISADWRAFITRHRVDIVIIDYLHKVYFDVVKGRSDEMHLASIVETFKTTAEQTGIPIMLGCQINREEIKSKHEQKITLNHLRGSGQVAEKSNVVLGIWNEPLMTGSWKDGNNVVSVYVLKNTPGQLGTAHLVWIPSRLKFRDVHESVPPMNQPVVVPWYSNGNGDDVSYKVVPDVSVPEQEPVPVPVPVVIKPVVL